MKFVYLIIIALAITNVEAQTLSLKGLVTDKSTSKPISYASIRIANTFSGTSTSINGDFELKVTQGQYTLITSSIGYISDTLMVAVKSNSAISISLNPVPINLPEVTVLPGENPALEIIRRAIEAKAKRLANLNSYIFRAYTKGIIRTTKDFTSRGSQASVSIDGKNDSLKITGIIENESKGYFLKPNNYKDEIIARKQTKNTSSAFNLLTGGRLLLNFYNDDIRFFNRPLMSPFTQDAIEYYDYLIEDTLAMDNQNVFKIRIEPLRKIDPGFTGTIYIADKSYSLVKLDLGLNGPANPGKMFSKINIIQNFALYKDIVMPVDYRIIAEGNAMGIFKFGGELNSIFYDYKINEPIDKDFFDMTVIKVSSDADKKDSLYWKSTQTIPNTTEELKAYQRIDSVEALPKGFAENFSLLATSIALDKNWAISGPLSLYSFNRVEGHTLNFGINTSELFDKRFNGNLDLSYGFDDKKMKAELTANYLFGEYRTTNLSIRLFNKSTDLFSEAMRFNKLTSTVTNLFGKYDYRNYYYTKGFAVNAGSQVFPILYFGVGFFNRTDNNGFVNTDFSFFNKSKTYAVNKTIYETKINAITTNFQFDFRGIAEDGYRKLRVGGNSYIFLGGNFTFSNSDFLKSDLDFQIYRFYLHGYFPTFKSASLRFSTYGNFSNGKIPFQSMYALPASIENLGQSYSFRTLRAGEVFGDRVATLFIEHNFNDEIFRLLHLNFLIDWQVNLSMHVNLAWLKISPESKSILPHSFLEFEKPFAEIGFGVGQSLFPFRLEFTWKLNYFGNTNFVFGINTPIL
ncbi:hypothetical protein C0389_01755 [bacterium]|nr:hypothetical protein [bacterium]